MTHGVTSRPAGRAHGRLGLPIVLTVSLAATALAQSESPSSELSLADCLQLAFSQSSEYREAVANAELSRGGAVSAWSNVLPNVSASASKTQRSSGGERVTVSGVEQSATFTQWGMSGSVRQNLVDLESYYRFRSSRRDWTAARHGLEARRQDIALDVAGRFFDVVTAMRTADLRRESLGLSEDQLRRTQALYDLGAVAKADVLESRVSVSRDKRDLISAENGLVISKGLLNLAIGRAADSPLEIDYQPSNVPETLPSVDEALATARDARPDLLETRAALEAASLEKKSAWWANMPSLTGSLSYDKDLPTFEDTFDFGELKGEGSRWGYTLFLSVPIFDGLVTKGQKIRAAGSQVAAAEALERTERTVLFEVRQALLDIEAARASLEVSVEEIASAEENLRLREAMYDQGAATILELIQARVDLTTARADQIANETAFDLAWYSFRKAIGDPLMGGSE